MTKIKPEECAQCKKWMELKSVAIRESDSQIYYFFQCKYCGLVKME